MKRALAILLTCITLLSACCLPVSVFAKSETLNGLSDLFITVPNGTQAKALRLRWDDYAKKADGYQIFRSSTGKSGSYKKVGTTKKCEYIDTNLKNQTVYYYAVRGYASKGGKTVYGPFAKDSGVTKITKAYVKQLLKKAYEVSDNWIYTVNEKMYDASKPITAKRKRTIDGETFTEVCYYFPITHKTITSKAKLKKYLKNYFDEYYVDSFVDEYYLDRNGRLYLLEPVWADASTQLTDKDEIRDITQYHNYATVSLLNTWIDPYGKYQSLNLHELCHTSSGRWVFSDAQWFPNGLM